MQFSRRGVLTSTSAGAVALLLRPDAVLAAGSPSADYPSFPSSNPMLVREMVGAAHRDIDKVRQLLSDAPQLANAAIDWGYGDWETPLGAAAHTGRREIALVLLQAGARPDIFSAAMLGQLEVVKAFVAAQQGVQALRGPHGLSLLHHARQGGDEATAVLEYLTQLGDADPQYTNLPLTDSARDAYLGDYRFGPGETETLCVQIPKRNAPLSIQRAGAAAVNLFHQGNHSFIPAGGNDVRIVFGMEAGIAVSLAVRTPKEIMTARRVNA